MLGTSSCEWGSQMRRRLEGARGSLSTQHYGERTTLQPLEMSPIAPVPREVERNSGYACIVPSREDGRTTSCSSTKMSRQPTASTSVDFNLPPHRNDILCWPYIRTEYAKISVSGVLALNPLHRSNNQNAFESQDTTPHNL
ncbi:hypothetical protein VNO77_02889 [Canavalia gladiata]|uniref:Uncharacterized protein n=1 Tax=Canavalia gladiata TaxID=3824 RepID=A0AAN9R6B8_CANGL